jgi:hypothetical protein
LVHGWPVRRGAMALDEWTAAGWELHTASTVLELRGLEPLTLPAEILYELRFRSVSFRFIPARYLRFRFRVLTASRAVTYRIHLMNPF